MRQKSKYHHKWYNRRIYTFTQTNIACKIKCWHSFFKKFIFIHFLFGGRRVECSADTRECLQCGNSNFNTSKIILINLINFILSLLSLVKKINLNSFRIVSKRKYTLINSVRKFQIWEYSFSPIKLSYKFAYQQHRKRSSLKSIHQINHRDNQCKILSNMKLTFYLNNRFCRIFFHFETF